EIGLNRETPYEISQEDGQIRVEFQKSPIMTEAAPLPAGAEPSAEPELEAYPPETIAVAGAVPEADPVRREDLPLARKIVAIQSEVVGQGFEVTIVADGRIDRYNAFPLSEPPRLVLDLMGMQSALDRAVFPLSDPMVKRIRLGTHPDKVRVVFDLVPVSGLPFQLIPENERFIVSFEPGPGFPPRKAEAETQPVESRPRAARISAIDFNMLDSNKSRLTITADRPLEPEVQITGANSISLIFPDAHLPKHLQRHIDTGQFASAVNLIDPRPMREIPRTVEFHIEMREMVPFHVARDGNKVHLDFDASTLPPPKPIKLGKPVTVSEARAPAEPAPIPEEMKEMPASEQVALPAPVEPVEEMEVVAAETAPEVAEVSPRSLVQPAPYSGQKISLDLQEVDVRNVLRLLADVTGKNIVVEPNVAGTVTLKVDSVPWDQVLDLILKINDLDKVMEGNVIRIATAAKIRGEFERRRQEVEAQKELMVAAMDLGEITTEYLQVNYADVNDVSNQIQNIKSDNGTISVDQRTNLIIYSDFPRRIETAKEVLARLDRATLQVMIESRIVEARTNFARNLGVTWSVSYTANRLSDELGGLPTFDAAVAAPVASIGTAGFQFSRITGSLVDIDMQLQALEQKGEGRVISAPRIFTLDHVQAMIQQGDQIPYPQRTQEGTISTAFAPATLSLTVTPHITPDGKVRLEVQAKKDEADFSRTVQDVPAIRTREAQTELLVNDGDTVVIGGVVIRDSAWAEDRVPFLSQVPVLGWLFKNREIREDKTELLIFLNPTIVKDEQYTYR
ncbi:MAG: type IV pilus secretin PilQ, partial [Deltaproteobacteria bacterium]